ncbi:MAG: IS4 family transposase [Dehalococcoidia bacterium]
MQRARKLTGSHFAQTLVWGFLAAPRATLGHLQQTAATTGVAVSPQAISQRCTKAAATFLQQLLSAAMALRFAAERVPPALLARFEAVYVGDSTIIPLPAALAEVWPGCGGSSPSSGAAQLKLQANWELVGGCLADLELQAGRASDQRSQQQATTELQPGLSLKDQGYFATAQLRELVAAGGHYLRRPPPQITLSDTQNRRFSLVRFLNGRRGQQVDCLVTLGTKHPLPCRLLALRVPAQIVALRRDRLTAEARRKGTPLSPTLWALCAWTVLVTDLPKADLSLAEALVLARLRWQVELLFKVWKSAGAQLEQWRTADPWRALCTVYAKLLACLVQHWLLQAGGWAFGERSLLQAAQVVRARAAALTTAFRQGLVALRAELDELARVLGGSCRITHRRGNPAAFQLLLALEAAA